MGPSRGSLEGIWVSEVLATAPGSVERTCSALGEVSPGRSTSTKPRTPPVPLMGLSGRWTSLEECMAPSVVSLLCSSVLELLARAPDSVTCGAAACPIWASSVGRRDPVTAEPRSGRGRRVVEGAGGARGAVGGVSGCFLGPFVPPAGVSRGGERAYAACTIWASSVGRRDPVTAEPRSGRGRRVVEGAGGARGAIGGVSECFLGRFVPPAGASRGGACVCPMPDMGVFRRSSGPGGGGASLWPRQARRGGVERSARSHRRGLEGIWCSCRTAGGRSPGLLRSGS